MHKVIEEIIWRKTWQWGEKTVFREINFDLPGSYTNTSAKPQEYTTGKRGTHKYSLVAALILGQLKILLKLDLRKEEESSGWQDQEDTRNLTSHLKFLRALMLNWVCNKLSIDLWMLDPQLKIKPLPRGGFFSFWDEEGLWTEILLWCWGGYLEIFTFRRT